MLASWYTNYFHQIEFTALGSAGFLYALTAVTVASALGLAFYLGLKLTADT